MKKDKRKKEESVGSGSNAVDLATQGWLTLWVMMDTVLKTKPTRAT